MKKLLIAALLGCAAMPAQAAQFIRYEGWGSAGGGYNSYVNGEYTPGIYYGSAHIVADFSLEGSGCNTMQYRCSRTETSLTFTTVDARNPFTFTLNFSEPLDGQYPLSNETFIGGTLQGFAYSIPGVTGLHSASPGTGYIQGLTVTTYTVDGYKAAEIYGSIVASAIPEPATWAMMIAGFGLAGAALRRRRATVQFA